MGSGPLESLHGLAIEPTPGMEIILNIHKVPAKGGSVQLLSTKKHWKHSVSKNQNGCTLWCCRFSESHTNAYFMM